MFTLLMHFRYNCKQKPTYAGREANHSNLKYVLHWNYHIQCGFLYSHLLYTLIKYY